MTTVKINDKNLANTTRIRDIEAGELFRNDSGEVYVMTDEIDQKDKLLALLISEKRGDFGLLVHFDECDRVTRLDGTISVTIN